MSGFLVSRCRAADDGFIRRRGPDLTWTLELEDYRFTQCLARVTGEVTPRPSADDGVVALFDGEIYDRPAGTGAGEALIRLFRQHGEDFARHLDGEFAAAVTDLGRRIMVLATDPFATKPLFVNGTEAASSLGALGGGERVAANTVIVLDLDRGESRRSILAPFDFDHQHKQSYDDWFAAFEGAVRKRAVDGCYLPLSAGYDSGAIDCALARLGIAYKVYSVEGIENLELLRRRNVTGEILRMDVETFAEQRAFLRRHGDAASFRVKVVADDGDEETYEPLEDGASCGLALIHSRARSEGRRVFLSGTGADEILAEYRRQWPEQLRPWPTFVGGWRAAYQGKEELVAGAFGVEGRYPFLDRAAVQEFLWLSPELKSRHYKAPLHEYMTRHGYPFDENVKRGFLPLCR